MAKGRKSRSIEFMQQLAEMFNLKPAAFAKKIGKQTSNITDYLSGKKTPKQKVLLSSARHAFEWDVTPIIEVGKVEEATKLPTEPGIYALYDSAGNAIYVGQAKNLKQEVNQTLNRAVNFTVRHGTNLSKKAKTKYKALAASLSAYSVPSSRMRHNLEALLLRTFPNQTHNNKMGNFK
jgi:hypothetical protein